MKRSEMVELLSKSFFKHMNDENYTNDTDMYSAILKDIEPYMYPLPKFRTKEDIEEEINKSLTWEEE